MPLPAATLQNPSVEGVCAVGASRAGLCAGAWPPRRPMRPCRPHEVSTPGSRRGIEPRFAGLARWHGSASGQPRRPRTDCRCPSGRLPGVECLRHPTWPAHLGSVGSVLEQAISGLIAAASANVTLPGTGPGSRVGVQLGRAATGIDGHVSAQPCRCPQGSRRSFTASCQISRFAHLSETAAGDVLPAGGVRGGRSAQASGGRPSAALLCCRHIVPKKV